MPEDEVILLVNSTHAGSFTQVSEAWERADRVNGAKLDWKQVGPSTWAAQGATKTYVAVDLRPIRLIVGQPTP